jgi:DNA-binding transcriptional LysR family regulator
MDKLRALQYFVAAAEGGSLSAAARSHDVSVPAVAKLVGALERELGVALFDRSTHGLTLTARGEAYLESCRPLLERLVEADRAVSTDGERPSGTLVVGAPPLLARLVLIPALEAFHQRCPDVRIELRPFDRLTVTQAEAQGLDAIVALGWPGDVDLVQRRLAQSRLLVCATPDYWRRHGLPTRPADMRAHRCLLVRSTEGTLLDLWRYRRGDEREEVALRGRFVSESRDLVFAGVLRGQGVGRFADLSIWPHLEDGSLQPVLLDWEPTDAPPFSVLYRREARIAPRVDAFVGFLVELFARIEAACISRFGARPVVQRPDWYAQRGGKASATMGRGP